MSVIVRACLIFNHSTDNDYCCMFNTLYYNGLIALFIDQNNVDHYA